MANPQNKDKLLTAIGEELDRIRKHGVTQEELEKAKDSYLSSMRVTRSNDSGLTNELLGTLFNERTMQHYADHEAQIEAATLGDVNQAIKKFIVPEKLVKAIAGDFAAE
jgi:zinc protease